MGTESTTPPQDEPDEERSAPPLPDDPRVPRLEDADPSTSKELGGGAPAVGGGPS